MHQLANLDPTITQIHIPLVYLNHTFDVSDVNCGAICSKILPKDNDLRLVPLWRLKTPIAS